MRKSTKTTLAIVALGMAIVIGLGFLTSGFQNWNMDDISSKVSAKVNPDNYYSIQCIELKDTYDGDGVKIDIDEDTGVITLNGVANVDKTGDNAYRLGTLTLDAGSYTLTSYDYASYSGVYLTAQSASNNWKFDFTPGNVITIPSDNTEIILFLNIAKDATFSNVKIEPVIVSGSEVGKYWK